MKAWIIGFVWLFTRSAMAAEPDTPAANSFEAQIETTNALEIAPITVNDRNLRALQLVQDRMAGGNSKAVDAQRALLEQMMVSLQTRSGSAGLSEVDVTRILPMILLNGADPERIRGILGESGIQSKEPFLLGALAYAEGRVSEALVFFESVKPDHLSPLSRAQFYLTNGVMLAEIAPEKAVLNFTKAQLAAPGTLIEEAALRREALLVMTKPERFLPLVRSYLHRFSNSPFASAFISQFAFSIGNLERAVQTQITVELDGLLAGAQSQDRQNFYSILARASLIGSNYALTDYATERALNEVKNPSQLLSARLYRASFDIAGVNYEEAAQELQSLTRAPLQATDREILAAAISVARELRRWPFDAVPEGGQIDPILPALPAVQAENSVNIAKAQKLLDDTAPLIGTTK
jgi:chemotaxis protein MotC